MAEMTTTTAAVFIPEVWSQETIQAVRSNLVLANLVWRFDKDVSNRGDIVHVPNVSNLTANTKVEGAEVSPQAPTESEVQITVDQWKETSFRVNDLAAAQADYDLMRVYTDQAGYAIAKAIDTSLAALATGFSNSKGTYNTAITTDVLLDSMEVLDLGDVPQEDRYFVFRPDVKRDLLDIDRYVDADFVKTMGVETGQIGTLYGNKTFMSNNILKTGNNTSNMLFHKHAIALAMQKMPRTQTEYQLEHLAHLVVVDTIYGVKEMRDAFGVEVKT